MCNHAAKQLAQLHPKYAARCLFSPQLGFYRPRLSQEKSHGVPTAVHATIAGVQVASFVVLHSSFYW
jgi:hypothetical protein